MRYEGGIRVARQGWPSIAPGGQADLHRLIGAGFRHEVVRHHAITELFLLV